MIKKIGLGLILLMLTVFTLQAQVPGTPFFWKKKQVVTSCPTSDKSTTKDTDGDGINDNCDLDSDNDGILDRFEDSNGNGKFNDDDNEGDFAVVNTIGDGVSNYLDLDSDNDGILDLWESGIPISILNIIDKDKNGIIDLDITVGANGFADILETFADSGIPKYALADSDCDAQPDYLDVASNNIVYDIVAIGKGSLDLLGGGFITPITDVDKDGIMDQVDTDLTKRGAPGSPISPYSNNTNVSLPDNNGDGISEGCSVPDLVPQFVFGSGAFPAYDPTGLGLTITNLNGVPTSGTITVTLSPNILNNLDINYDPNANNIIVNGLPIAVSNINWNVAVNAGVVTLTSKPGYIIPANSSATIGFAINWNLANFGDPVNLRANIVTGSGGEVNAGNNSAILPLQFEP